MSDDRSYFIPILLTVGTIIFLIILFSLVALFSWIFSNAQVKKSPVEDKKENPDIKKTNSENL